MDDEREKGADDLLFSRTAPDTVSFFPQFAQVFSRRQFCFLVLLRSFPMHQEVSLRRHSPHGVPPFLVSELLRRSTVNFESMKRNFSFLYVAVPALV